MALFSPAAITARDGDDAMTDHLKIKPAAPWHWDGQDPLDKPVVAQPRKPKTHPAPGSDEYEDIVRAREEPETWDIDGLGR